MLNKNFILTIIVFSQFCCTSLWFAGNGVMNDLVLEFGLRQNALGHLTSAVQFGFISGTLLFAMLTIADRFAPSKVFLISALSGALFNLFILWEGNTLYSLILFRFLTGFFLAGIYPVGMKIAADYFEKGLGLALGLLVGALVVGTGAPHLINYLTTDLSWGAVLVSTSSFAVLGGLLMFLLVPNGPFRKKGQRIDLKAFTRVFKNLKFKSAAFGYFGHMWELYTFWAFVPVMLNYYTTVHQDTVFNIPVLSFSILSIGGVACVLGGLLSSSYGVKRIAFLSLSLSGACCLIFPLAFTVFPPIVFLVFMHFWGMVVIADSPLFSTLVAQNAEAQIKGTALTIVNCIGFFITIFSIQLVTFIFGYFNSPLVFTILTIGPIFGLYSLSKKDRRLMNRI